MVDQSKDDKKKGSAKSADSKENSDFSSAFDPNLTALESPNIRGLTEGFIIDFSTELSSFVGRSFELQFTELQLIETKTVFEQNAPMIFSSFQMSEHSYHGFLIFQPLLLDRIVNLLFGSNELLDEPPLKFGKCALTIAKKITEVCLSSIEKSLEDIKPVKIHLINSHENPKAIRSRYMPNKSCQLSFNISGMEANNSLSIILPESFIELMTYQDKTDEIKANTNSIGVQFHSDIIGSSVEVVALLPEIKLKLSDVMNLKSGDLIPIENPEQVELKLGQKKAYKAIVGQANDRRVVKITKAIN